MANHLQTQIEAIDRASPERTGKLVDLILAEAVQCAASDVHFEPTHHSLDVRFRLDGVLHPMATLSRELAANVVARLKVLAELLTYRQDIPQEGRLADGQARFGVDMRVSTFPTIHGEKAAVRLFGAGAAVLDLDQVGLPDALLADLRKLVTQRSGAIFLTGPAAAANDHALRLPARPVARKPGRQAHRQAWADTQAIPSHMSDLLPAGKLVVTLEGPTVRRSASVRFRRTDADGVVKLQRIPV